MRSGAAPRARGDAPGSAFAGVTRGRDGVDAIGDDGSAAEIGEVEAESVEHGKRCTGGRRWRSLLRSERTRTRIVALTRDATARASLTIRCRHLG